MQVTALGGGRGWLDYPAALSLFRLDARVGHLWQISEAGRTWAQQNKFRQDYLNGVPGAAFALPPDPPGGPSIHQLGNAIDTNERIVWLLNEYGWFQTALARDEPWHFEYDWSRDQHRNEGIPAGAGDSADFPTQGNKPPAPIEEEEDDMSRNAMVFKFANEANTLMSVMAFNTDTGWETIWHTSVDSTWGNYNNELRKALSAGETTANVTPSHWDAIRASNAELRARITGSAVAEKPAEPTPPKA